MFEKKDFKGKFYFLVWFEEGRYLGLLFFGLWFEGLLIFLDFGLFCRKENGVIIYFDFLFF